MGEIDRSAPVYPIGVVQKLTGLSGRQIRYYEQVGLINPQRTKGNQRLYSPLEVDRLLEIRSLLGQGLNIEGVRTQLAFRQETTLPAPAEPAATDPPPRIDHDLVIAQMRAGVKLASLYPVNNQAELMRLLEEGRRTESGLQQD